MFFASKRAVEPRKVRLRVTAEVIAYQRDLESLKKAHVRGARLGFVLVHYAGEVTYDMSSFLLKT